MDRPSRRGRRARNGGAPTRSAVWACRGVARARPRHRRSSSASAANSSMCGVSAFDLLDRDALAKESAVVQSAPPGARRLHRFMEGRVVVGGNRVHRDSHQGCLDDPMIDKGAIQIGRIEVPQPTPERDVRGGGHLRVERDDPLDGVGRVELFATKQHLAGERGPIELSGGEAHARYLASPPHGGVGLPGCAEPGGAAVLPRASATAPRSSADGAPIEPPPKNLRRRSRPASRRPRAPSTIRRLVAAGSDIRDERLEGIDLVQDAAGLIGFEHHVHEADAVRKTGTSRSGVLPVARG